MAKPTLQQIQLLLLMLVPVALLFSRAMLSLCIVAIAAVIITGFNYRKTLLTQLTIWSCTPLLIFFTGWYQHPLAPGTYDYFATLLMYPVAAVALQLVDSKSLRRFILVWIALGFVSLLYPLGWYITHVNEVHLAYGRGQSLPTFMDGDHVRYGIFLNSVLLLLAVVTGIRPLYRNILIILLCLVIAIIAVRTAWIGMMLIAVGGALSRDIAARKLFRKMTWFIVPLSVLAWLYIPTVKQKISYAVYDYLQFEQTQNSSYSDGTRRSINYSAWQAVKKDYIAGTGWDGIEPAIRTSFARHYPGKTLAFYWPFNQWLYWWLGGGLLSLLLFSAWLFYPLFAGLRQANSAIWIWTLFIAATCVVESTLSLQYGVALHAWPIAIFWSWRSRHKEHSAEDL